MRNSSTRRGPFISKTWKFRNSPIPIRLCRGIWAKTEVRKVRRDDLQRNEVLHAISSKRWDDSVKIAVLMEVPSWISLFSRNVSMNFAVFTKCLHEFERFDRCVSYFRKQRHRSCWKINLLGSDEGKWDSWNFEIASTRNGLSDEFDGSYLIISNIWWTRSYEVGRLRCSWLRIKKIQVYTLGEHESLENEGTSIFWMLMKIETQQWFWWIWGSRACNLAVFHAISLFSMQNMVKIAVFDCSTWAEMSYFGKTPEFFSNCGVSVDRKSSISDSYGTIG